MAYKTIAMVETIGGEAEVTVLKERQIGMNQRRAIVEYNGAKYLADYYDSYKCYFISDGYYGKVTDDNGLYSKQEIAEKWLYATGKKDKSDFEYLKTTKDKIAVDEMLRAVIIIGEIKDYELVGSLEQLKKRLGKVKKSYTVDKAVELLQATDMCITGAFIDFVNGTHQYKRFNPFEEKSEA